MGIKLILVALTLSGSAIAQVPINFGFVLSKEYSHDIAIVKAKAFVMKEILNSSAEIGQFEFDLLAATSLGELTTFFYRCKEENKEGLILGFYGDYWNNADDAYYKGFTFKNIPKNNAIELLSKITMAIEEQKEFLSKNMDNNIYFQYDDISFLIYKNINTKIRVFWNDFDAEWENLAFTKTIKKIPFMPAINIQE